MIPEAPLVFLRHPMVTRSAAWLCRLPANHLVVSRRPCSSNVKPHRQDFKFDARVNTADLPLGLLSEKPVTRYLQARAESGFIGIHAPDPYCCDAGSYPEHRVYQSNYTAPILGRVEKQIRNIRRAQSLPTPRGNGVPEYIEHPIQLLDTLTNGINPMSYNATIIRLGETLARVVNKTYTNIRGFNSAFQSATIGIRRGISLYRALSEGSNSRTISSSSFQPRWVHLGPLVDEPETIRPYTIGSNMNISEIASILRDRCCKSLGRLLSLRSCSTHPVSNGGFGDIYLGKLENGSPVAVKVARYCTNSARFGKQSKHTARELHTWAKCQHPNVIPLLGMIEFRDQIAMVSPWMKNGDLRSYLGQHPEADRCQLCHGICDGLAYLHGMNIVHGDLKGANILISDSGKPMISDFGNSLIEDKSIRFTATTRNTACSSRWAAPEILEGAPTSYPADVFALGMTLLEAITGDVPYQELEREQAVIVAILFKKVVPARPTAYIPQKSAHGDPLWNLLTRCWAYEPSDRPHAEEVQSLVKQFVETYDRNC